MTAYMSNCHLPELTVRGTVAPMSKNNPQDETAGSWVFRDIPRDLMHKVKVAAAIERKSVKQLLIDLSRAHLEEMGKKGLLPKGK